VKVAILADIHANLPALLAVAAHVDAWQPDLVIVAGDVVNRGPRPAECWRFVAGRQWPTVRGNHEDYVLAHGVPGAPRAGPLFEIFRSSFWTYEALDGAVPALAAMPFQHSFLAPDGSEARVVHASMRGTRDGVFPDTPDEVLHTQIGRPVVPLFVVGHTHWPLVRRLGHTLVVNVGAVGMPFDGDPRASYGQLTWQDGTGWQATIARVPYDRDQTARDFLATGFLAEGGPLVELMLIELQRARSQLYSWSVAYEKPVLAGELTLADSVRRFRER
jgi:predicted phosphodiesterase